MTKASIKKLVSRAIDLHVHIGPEVIPRKYNSVTDLIKAEAGKIAGMALKNHFYLTQPFINEVKKSSKLILVGGVVLNNFQGGLNPEAIYANAILSKLPTVVWLPTVSAQQFLAESEYEIAPEWVQQKGYQARSAGQIKAVVIDNKINAVLQAISENNAILATGHVSWQEATKVVKKAALMGIQKMIVTHPIYGRINFPITEQKKLAQLGAKMEHCFSMYSIDKIPMSRIAEQIKAVGAENCVLSSDVGQSFSPAPSMAMAEFASLLLKAGITEKELEIMMIRNPRQLIGIG